MIRFLVCFLLFLFSVPFVFADAEWDELRKSGNLWDNQKPITDEEFEKVMERYEKNPKLEKQKKKMGQELFKHSDSYAPESVLKEMEEYTTIMIPCTLVAQGQEVPAGYYRIVPSKKKNGEHEITLYQGNSLKFVFLAKEIHDFDYPEIKFSILKPFLNDYMRIIVGNVDCNIDVYLRIKTNKDKVYIQEDI